MRKVLHLCHLPPHSGTLTQHSRVVPLCFPLPSSLVAFISKHTNKHKGTLARQGIYGSKCFVSGWPGKTLSTLFTSGRCGNGRVLQGALQRKQRVCPHNPTYPARSAQLAANSQFFSFQGLRFTQQVDGGPNETNLQHQIMILMLDMKSRKS